MTFEEVKAHYGSVRAIAQALQLSSQAIYQWPEQIPLVNQVRLEQLTQGALKAEVPVYQPRTRKPKVVATEA